MKCYATQWFVDNEINDCDIFNVVIDFLSIRNTPLFGIIFCRQKISSETGAWHNHWINLCNFGKIASFYNHWIVLRSAITQFTHETYSVSNNLNINRLLQTLRMWLCIFNKWQLVLWVIPRQCHPEIFPKLGRFCQARVPLSFCSPP